MPAESAAPRLARLLTLVPWVISHPGVTVEEVCGRFGVTREDLVADLNLLFLCGLPPFGPGDLIDATIDGDVVHIDMADYLARPVRLTRREALTLLVVGRAIAGLKGLDEAASLRSALGKLERAVAHGDAEAAADLAGRVEVELDREGAERIGALRDAIASGGRLRVEYYTAGRNEMGKRTLCPLIVFTAMGRWYLDAHDDVSGEARVFRVDRIRAIAPAVGACPDPAIHDAAGAAPESLFAPSEHDLQAVIEIPAEAAWVAETTPHELAEEVVGGKLRLTLRTPHLAWLERLLMRVGPGARAVAPPELASGVRELAARTLARYRS